MNYIWKKYPSLVSISSTTINKKKQCSLVLIPLESNNFTDTTIPETNDFTKSLFPLEESKANLYQQTEEQVNCIINAKKKGRKKKNEIVNQTVDNIHSKLYQDNIKRKIKTHFHNFIIAFFNSEIRKEWNMQKYKLRKINSKITQNITIAYNKDILSKPIKDILCDVSTKFRDKSANEKFINKILKYRPHLSTLLNTSYEEIFTEYYLKSTSEMFQGSSKDESFETHLNKILKKDGIDYRDRYYINSREFVDFFKHSKQRFRQPHK